MIVELKKEVADLQKMFLVGVDVVVLNRQHRENINQTYPLAKRSVKGSLISKRFDF